MQLKEHIAYGGAASVALYPVFGVRTLLFFLASVLIDADHYLDYLYYTRFKNWSVKTMFKFHGTMAAWRNKPDICALEAFHTAEFLAALGALALAFHSVELSLIFWGMIFHMVLDLIRLTQWKRVDLRALSFTEYWIRKKRMMARGIHPETIFEEAYRTVSQELDFTPAESRPQKLQEIVPAVSRS